MDLSKIVEAQLNTIKAIIPSTIAIYQNSNSLSYIKPNLDMMKIAIDILQDMAEEETYNTTFEVKGPEGMNITYSIDKEDLVLMFMEGTEIAPNVDQYIFGPVDNAVQATLKIPIICGKTYTVKQINPMLAIYDSKDSFVSNENGNWTKEKNYLIEDEDFLEYSFLIGTGRSSISIEITGDDFNVRFEISTHVHLKK